MKLRIIYSLIYILCVAIYIALPKEDAIRWATLFTSTVGVLVSFTFAGRFIWKRSKPNWIKPFRIILIIINAMYMMIFPLGMWSGYYANGFLSLIFVAPITALLIETFIPRQINETTEIKTEPIE